MSVLVFTASPGYWGNAETFDDAVCAAKWIEVGTEIFFVECNPDDYIDETGLLMRHGNREEMKPVFRAQLRIKHGEFFPYKSVEVKRP